MDERFALEVEVEVESDVTGEVLPRRLGLGARSVAVAEVLDRWPGTDYSYVKVRGADGALYILRHDESGDRWQLVQFIRGGTSWS
jgi:hypothetical protein